jgi:hypothetical protein
MTTSPLRAFYTLYNISAITINSLLYLITSYVNTVFIDSVYSVGYFSITISKSNAGGVFVSKSIDISIIIYSLVLPPEAEVLGWMERMFSSIILVSD